VRTHKDLEVWKQAMQLANETYRATASFPKEELYGLALQARRSAVSIASNIAEGAARNSRKEFVQYLHISVGSVAELDTQLLLAQSLGFLADETIHHHVTRVRKMLSGLIASLRKDKPAPVTRHPSLVT